MKFAQDIILTPVITENSMDLARNQKKYTFKVAKDANKIEIAKAVEEAEQQVQEVTQYIDDKKIKSKSDVIKSVEDMNIIVKCIKNFGFERKELKTSGFEIIRKTEPYRDENNDYKHRFIGYQYNQNLNFTLF